MPPYSVKLDNRNISGVPPGLWILLTALAFFLPQLLIALPLLIFLPSLFCSPAFPSPIPLTSLIFRAYSPSRGPPA